MKNNDEFKIVETLREHENMKNGVLVIGNFDGVHRAHQIVLKKAREISEKENKPVVAMSFEPHPRTLFKPQEPVFRLSPKNTKAKLLKACGMDGLIIVPFTRELADTSAEQFIQKYICENAQAKHVIIGFNFYFGKNRGGDPEFLKNKGKEFGFETTIIDEQKNEIKQPISSSQIREYLENAEIKNATEMLGYRWIVQGKVIEGEKIGRKLGFPTANIKLEKNTKLASGIYAVKIKRQNNEIYNGVASYGRRPTFDNGEKIFETFIFDFNENIYDEIIEVSLFEYIREELKFENEQKLKEQMKMDEKNAREIMKNAKPISEIDEQLMFVGKDK